jgi:aminoglycoside 3-N-acetyltransferase
MNTKSMHKRILTREDIREALVLLGLQQGSDVMVHAAMKGIGYLVNGADDIVDAIMEVIGSKGTLLAPGHSGQLCDPNDWTSPPPPEGMIEGIRQNMKPFDKHRTPIRNRGAVADAVFRMPNVLRSNHPLVSVLAVGASAEAYTANHPLHACEGIGSPHHKLYEQGGKILLFGVDMSRCTALHVAEFIADCSYLKENIRNVLVEDDDGRRHFVRLQRYPGMSQYFPKMQSYLKSVDALTEVDIDGYVVTLFNLKVAVDFGAEQLLKDEQYFQKP